jgi:hypothetical protein
MKERDLLVVYKAARQELDATKEQLKEVQARYDEAETKMVEHLTAIGADATAKYDGIGYAKLQKPRVYASCLKENEDRLKAYLREKGREDLVREVVNAQSLSGYVGELIEAGKPLPDMVTYFLKQAVRLY